MVVARSRTVWRLDVLRVLSYLLSLDWVGPRGHGRDRQLLLGQHRPQAHEVSLGRTVRLPGFGSFSATFSARYYASSRTCAPRFKASKASRLQTHHSAPLDLAKQAPSPLLTRGRTRPAWCLEEEEVTTREAILKALDAAD